jgi:predicted Zn-dependent protease
MDLSDIPLTRRCFLSLTGAAAGSLILGCAVNPVTGKQQLMLISEGDERRLDRVNSPHQFSADYGSVQDRQLSDYIQGIGSTIASETQRPQLPYRFVPLNATYVNAYTFPAGSVGITRGILLELESEAALAALIGHELGHVNARHTAQAMSKSILASLAVSGLASAASDLGQSSEQLAAGLGQVAAGALLARYSRDNEREADSLALTYMFKAGYGPHGHTELMDMLRSLSKHKPSAIELMFATHPMSDERYRDSLKGISKLPPSSEKLPLNSERYMDSTAKLRSIGNAIDSMQKGERLLSRGKYSDAESFFKEALRFAPGDYAGLLLMAKCQLALEKPDVSKRFAQDASSVYPGEPQALHVLGMTELVLKNYRAAYNHFQQYGQILPGNPNTVFYQGFSAEGMKNRDLAASRYYSYLKEVNKGKKAEYAYGKLKEWGYVK